MKTEFKDSMGYVERPCYKKNKKQEKKKREGKKDRKK